MEEIARTVVGLKTYEVKIDKKDMDEYMKFSQSHENPNLNIWDLARPWVKKWAKKNISFDAKIRDSILDLIALGRKFLREL
jgi:hypothetical protein